MQTQHKIAMSRTKPNCNKKSRGSALWDGTKDENQG